MKTEQTIEEIEPTSLEERQAELFKNLTYWQNEVRARPDTADLALFIENTLEEVKKYNTEVGKKLNSSKKWYEMPFIVYLGLGAGLAAGATMATQYFL
jgi:hypothetical protein